MGALPPLAPYLKLPVPVQMTSLRRYLSPVEANGGPHLSAMLLEILRRDNTSGRGSCLPRRLACSPPTVTYERALPLLPVPCKRRFACIRPERRGERRGERRRAGRGRAGRRHA